MNVLDLDDWDPLSRKSITTNPRAAPQPSNPSKDLLDLFGPPPSSSTPSSAPPTQTPILLTSKPTLIVPQPPNPAPPPLRVSSLPTPPSSSPRNQIKGVNPLVTLATSESPTLFDLEELDPLKLGGRAAVAAEKVDLVAGGKTKKGHFGVFDRLASGVAGGVNAVVVDPEREALLSKILDLQESLREQVLRTETARIEHRHLSEEDGILRKYIQNLMVNTRRFE